MIDRDVARYEELLTSMASLSGLFSASDVPYVDSRFVEKLFVLTTGATDFGRADMSFDALLPGGIGVGVKTFVGGNGSHKIEKVAEFTALAREGHFHGIGKKELVLRIAEARNTRISSNVEEYGIDLENCVYHCLIRLSGGAIVHEEPYQLIDVKNMKPLTQGGRIATDWAAMGKGVSFTDGRSAYSYSVSKNVLMKRFDFDARVGFIPLRIDPDPMALLNSLVGRPVRSSRKFASTLSGTMVRDFDHGVKGVDYVVLPLYAPNDHRVHPRSGINQWNASGRVRKFGEAYIKIPAEVRRRFPRFFPPRDTYFDLLLPNGAKVHRAKVCQEGSKALMTESNIELGRWLISVIDPKTHPSDFGAPVGRRRPYVYSDLAAIGSDSVVISRTGSGRGVSYSAHFAPIGSFEDFMQA